MPYIYKQAEVESTAVDEHRLSLPRQASKKDYYRQYTSVSKNVVASRRKNETADILFAERFSNVRFRDFQGNTQMNVNVAEHKEAQGKRDRQINYWKNNVIQNFLPPIKDSKRKQFLQSEIRRRGQHSSSPPPQKRTNSNDSI